MEIEVDPGCDCITGNEDCCQCSPKGNFEMDPPYWAEGWFCVFQGEGISAATSLGVGQDNALLFNEDGTQYALSIDGNIDAVYDVYDPNFNSPGPLSGCPFTAVEAAHVQGDAIYLIEKGSYRYVTKRADWGAITELDQWGDNGTHPFLSSGVGAGLGYTNGRSIHFNVQGTQWAVYLPSTGEFTNASPFTNDKWGNDGTMPFIGTGVGAGLEIRAVDNFLPNGSGQLATFHVLFNKAGTGFAIWRDNYISSSGIAIPEVWSEVYERQ